MKQFFLIFLSVSWALMLPFAMFGLEPCRKWPMLQNVSFYAWTYLVVMFLVFFLLIAVWDYEEFLAHKMWTVWVVETR